MLKGTDDLPYERSISTNEHMSDAEPKKITPPGRAQLIPDEGVPAGHIVVSPPSTEVEAAKTTTPKTQA